MDGYTVLLIGDDSIVASHTSTDAPVITVRDGTTASFSIKGNDSVLDRTALDDHAAIVIAVHDEKERELCESVCAGRENVFVITDTTSTVEINKVMMEASLYVYDKHFPSMETHSVLLSGDDTVVAKLANRSDDRGHSHSYNVVVKDGRTVTLIIDTDGDVDDYDVVIDTTDTYYYSRENARIYSGKRVFYVGDPNSKEDVTDTVREVAEFLHSRGGCK